MIFCCLGIANACAEDDAWDRKLITQANINFAIGNYFLAGYGVQGEYLATDDIAVHAGYKTFKQSGRIAEVSVDFLTRNEKKRRGTMAQTGAHDDGNGTTTMYFKDVGDMQSREFEGYKVDLISAQANCVARFASDCKFSDETTSSNGILLGQFYHEVRHGGMISINNNYFYDLIIGTTDSKANNGSSLGGRAGMSHDFGNFSQMGYEVGYLPGTGWYLQASIDLIMLW